MTPSAECLSGPLSKAQRAAFREAIFGHQPAMKLAGRMLKCLQQRTFAAEHHDVSVAFEAWPGDCDLLHHRNAEFDVHRGFESGAHQFAFALARVAIADARASADGGEGTTAFLEKRKPRWAP